MSRAGVPNPQVSGQYQLVLIRNDATQQGSKQSFTCRSPLLKLPPAPSSPASPALTVWGKIVFW